MKKLSNLASIFGGLLFVSACIGLMTAPTTIAQGSLGGKDVRVINTAGEAVPVQVQSLPAVQVSGTPTVKVGNTPSVNVSSLPEVQVGNDASNPVPVSVTNQPGTASSEPVTIAGNLSVNSTGFGTFAAIYTVPADKRLVIEYENIQCFESLAGLEHSAKIYPNNSSSPRQFGIVFNGRRGTAEYASNPVQIFFGPGEEIFLDVERSGSGSNGQYSYAFTGHLTDVP